VGYLRVQQGAEQHRHGAGELQVAQLAPLLDAPMLVHPARHARGQACGAGRVATHIAMQPLPVERVVWGGNKQREEDLLNHLQPGAVGDQHPTRLPRGGGRRRVSRLVERRQED